MITHCKIEGFESLQFESLELYLSICIYIYIQVLSLFFFLSSFSLKVMLALNICCTDDASLLGLGKLRRVSGKAKPFSS